MFKEIKLDLIEDPKSAEQLLFNIDKRLERITMYLSAICFMMGGIIALLFIRL